MRLRFVVTAALSAGALAVAAPVAVGQTTSPDQDGYAVPGAAVQTQVESGNEPTPPTPVNDQVSNSQPTAAVQATDDSTLPFTGLDIALIVGAGGVLLLLGFGIRRLSRPAGLA
jgi:hypothetical protein